MQVHGPEGSGILGNSPAGEMITLSLWRPKEAIAITTAAITTAMKTIEEFMGPVHCWVSLNKYFLWGWKDVRLEGSLFLNKHRFLELPEIFVSCQDLCAQALSCRSDKGIKHTKIPVLLFCFDMDAACQHGNLLCEWHRRGEIADKSEGNLDISPLSQDFAHYFRQGC